MQETVIALNTFMPAMPGARLARGGGAVHKSRPKEVMNRLAARGAPLSARGKNDWTWFVEIWDGRIAVQHGADWGKMFAEQMQHLAESLAAGHADAVAKFMANETKRVLHDVVVLQV